MVKTIRRLKGKLLTAASHSTREPCSQARILQVNPDVFSESDAREWVDGACARVMLQPSFWQTPESG